MLKKIILTFSISLLAFASEDIVEKVKEEILSYVNSSNEFITLDFSDSNLTELPNEIGLLQDNLVRLYLNNNKLVDLPSEIGNLKKLRYLLLNNNRIEKLPNKIENLDSLVYLSLSNNKLVDLPSEIGNLKNLENLYLNDNKLKSIPNTIGNLTKVKTLDLSNNELIKLPKEIENICREYKDSYHYRFVGLSNVCKLDISNNKLSYLPKEIADIKLFDCFDCYNINENSDIGLRFNNNYFDKLPLSFKNIQLGIFFVDRNGFHTWFTTNFENIGYEFYSLLIDYSFEDNKTISFKPILGDDFNITSYSWNFGDGNSSTDENPTHTYKYYRNYKITLTLNGGEYSTSKIISIYPRVLELKKGWNMITPPTKDDINASLFDIVWSYENDIWENNHSYLIPTLGYWVKLNEDLNYSYNSEVYELPNYKIKEGWNFVGSGENWFREVNQTIYQYKNSSWLINPREIKRGDGFWVKID